MYASVQKLLRTLLKWKAVGIESRLSSNILDFLFDAAESFGLTEVNNQALALAYYAKLPSPYASMRKLLRDEQIPKA